MPKHDTSPEERASVEALATKIAEKAKAADDDLDYATEAEKIVEAANALAEAERSPIDTVELTVDPGADPEHTIAKLAILADDLRTLADARAEQARIKALIADQRERIANSELGQQLNDLEANLATIQQHETYAEAAVRMAALAAYDGNTKRLQGAVTVSDETILEYDKDKAIEVAQARFPQAVNVTLRVKEFEKIARVVELDFVTKRAELGTKIDKDLSAWRSPGKCADCGAELPPGETLCDACVPF